MRTTTYAWQQAVQDAIGESDADQLERRIQLAEIAIFERIDTFSATDSGETIAPFVALGKLRALRGASGKLISNSAMFYRFRTRGFLC
jgi:hypothetical protein